VAKIVLALFFIAALPSLASATAQYASRTGLNCSACHVNQLGGGELTAFGHEFADARKSAGKSQDPSRVQRAVHLLVGYLHILAGVVWFGTIFYVHIILKPAYASKGLPRGELVLGWTCIGIIAVTGTLLAVARMTSFSAFYETRFGILLSVKILLFLVMAATAAVATFVIGPRLRKRAGTTDSGDGVFTPESLQEHDGREDARAYVAVEGTVYDVTASRLWKQGKHMRHLAGADMTAAIRQAPHGQDKLAGMPVVGRLVDAPPAKPKGPKAVFYFMAYMNLAMVFAILGIIALWRWW
jgi:predicted heme/steroid binding protein/uncharacterized membrane protein